MEPAVIYILLLYVTCEPLKQHDKVTLNFVILTMSCFFDIVVILREHKSLLRGRCAAALLPHTTQGLRCGNCADLEGTDTLVRNVGTKLPLLSAQWPKRAQFSSTLRRKPQIAHRSLIFFGILWLLSVTCEELQGSVLGRGPAWVPASTPVWTSLLCYSQLGRAICTLSPASGRLPHLSALVLCVPGVM